MEKVKIYKTKQRAEVEAALKQNGGAHITADELCERLSSAGKSVGRTTVYRCLERLVAEGKARKYDAAVGDSACFQYIDEGERCHEHFHLKCTECGELIHVECENIEELCTHIFAHHNFCVDKLKTVLYGVCEQCAKR